MLRAVLILAAALVCATPAAAQQAQANPALFVVRDADSTLYLFGTVHALPAGSDWASPAVLDAIREADEIWTESDISGAGQAQFSADMMRALLQRAETPLWSRLPPEYQYRLRSLAKAFGSPPSLFEGLDPWEAALLVMQFSLETGGRASEAGADWRIFTMATDLGKRMRWLERMGVADFEALPERTQVEFLMYLLDGAEASLEEMRELEAMWARGDLEGLYAAEFEGLAENYPALYAWIAVARNTAWMDVLVAELDGAGVDFVAVGAAHLMGPDSLIAMFEARGYTVERVTPATPAPH